MCIWRHYIISLFALLCIYMTPLRASHWTLLIYMNAADLHESTLRTLNDLAQGIVPNQHHATVLLHINTYDGMAWRYKIKSHSIVQEACIPVRESLIDDILDAASWAYETYPAQHKALIFSGHGQGILQTTWHEDQQDWFAESDEPYALRITKKPEYTDTYCLAHHRSWLLSNQSKTALTNADMTHILKKISSRIDSKIDLFGLDMCLGASVEQVYQVAPYVQYMVASQNCQMKEGFAYKALAQRLSESYCTPKNLAITMIHDYQAYYEKRSSQDEYTLSAINCSACGYLKKALDTVACTLQTCIEESPELVARMKDAVHNHMPRFCGIPMYRDINTLCLFLDECIQQAPSLQEHTRSTAHAALTQAQNFLHSMVIANSHGTAMDYAHGLTVYMPCYHIDSSYRSCAFAQAGSWLHFLERVTNKD